MGVPIALMPSDLGIDPWVLTPRAPLVARVRPAMISATSLVLSVLRRMLGLPAAPVLRELEPELGHPPLAPQPEEGLVGRPRLARLVEGLRVGGRERGLCGIRVLCIYVVGCTRHARLIEGLGRHRGGGEGCVNSGYNRAKSLGWLGQRLGYHWPLVARKARVA